MIPAFEQSKTVHALDREETVIDNSGKYFRELINNPCISLQMLIMVRELMVTPCADESLHAMVAGCTNSTYWWICQH
jgi:hypothetical protein